MGRDCLNIRNFFRKHCERTLPVRKLFDFITEDKLPPAPLQANEGGAQGDEVTAALQAMLDGAEEDEDDEVQDEIFLNTWIHTSLSDISDRKFMEIEIDKRNRGEEGAFDNLVVSKKPCELDEDHEEGSNACSSTEEAVKATNEGGDQEGSDDGSGGDESDGQAKNDG